ncbi:MAG: magnesium/cobalt transporter CorA [Candidatus Omnitrophica bacterium]|nr:magnesium/cobalt transporter CorA [Candidatus Omnitrophota bacterium]MBU4487841.1 magnesium/cobalt transporter CorA [Candidatus Omnitrophota bacterium]MCG2704624.1 magnesium/cobalt transporter CorA [Candidatus Omnitrophota bacterium]
MATALVYYKGNGEIINNLKPEEMKAVVQSEKDVLWLDIIDPEKAELDMIEKVFELHPLTIEDCINTITRPKVDRFEKYLFIVMHGATLTPRAQKVKMIELNMCIGSNYIITIHQELMKGISSTMERIQKNPQSMAKGADVLLHLVVDSLVDNYLPVLDVMDYKISNIETQMLKNPTQSILNSIFTLKKEVLNMRRFIGPQRDTVNFLSKEDSPFIHAKTRIYFRDVYDNMIFINDTIDTYRDVLNSALDVYISTVSNKTNDIMKVLTMIATIMMPLTLITGVYGMNFRYMPILNWEYGFLGISIVMLLLGISMLVYFKRKEWL